MLRSFRRSDIPEYLELYRKYFPEEARILLTDAGAFGKVIERAFRLRVQFLVQLLRLLGRPVGHFYAEEIDGHLAGTSFLFFTGPTGYIGSVVVDERYRGRGIAKKFLAESEAATARRGRPYVALEVFSNNAPAKKLYESAGYKRIRQGIWCYRDLGEGHPPLPMAGGVTPPYEIRAFRKSDGDALAGIARSHQPELDRVVRPVGPRDFLVAPILAQLLGGETEAFVLTRAGVPVGFTRTTAGSTSASGNLVSPVLDDAVPLEVALALVDRALNGFARYPNIRRVVCEGPDDLPRVRALLEARGFVRDLPIETLAKQVRN